MGGSKFKEENGTSMGMAERRSGERGDEHEHEHENEHEHEHEQCPCPSTSDEDDPGLRPKQLYGKFTWRIENFSQISKRELRSNVFEVGGYKWYILVYPQGCDVCNHLSLFLCVADYDKLLPGWSHFAQFTIAVVNKDPKKSKYSDTLHRFCKKEHDWGWKKFMEVSKVLDGFTMADTLVIKAQVQVIRENPHRPFRCLDCQYRRELVRVYITNVEAICRRFVEEKREKLAKLREDTAKWSSFRTFWLAVDEDEQRRMSREKTDVILKQVVKRFFNEKEVTSTLVMDALYSGYKALECQSANNKGKSRSMDLEDISSPVVCVEKDVFVLADDVLSLLERAATEPLPPLKDDKGPQNRTKDGGSGDDFGRDSVDCDEKCLTELGRRTVEMFVLAHLYSNHVEMAYQRDVSIKMQEELIREEEAASHAEIEQRAKREAADKEKRSKKKQQAKQRRRTPKEKDRVRNDNGDINSQHQHQHQQEILSVIRNVDASFSKESSLPVLEILGTPDEGDLSGMDKTDNVVGIIGPETEDGDVSRVDWDRDSSEMQQDMEASFSGSVSVSEQSARMGRKQRHALDDSSSTCSTDSLASVAMNGSYKGNSSNKCESLSTRGKNKSNSERYDTNSGTRAGASVVAISALEANNNISKSNSNEEVLTLRQQVQWLEQRIVEKDDEISLLKNKVSSYQQQIDCDKPSKQQDMTASHRHTRNAGLSSSRIVDDDDEHKSSCLQADDSTLKYGSSCSSGELQVKCFSKDLHTESGNMEDSNLSLKKTNTLSHSVSFKQNMKKTVPPTCRSREINQSAKSATTAPLQIASDEMLRPSSAPLIPAVPRSIIPAVLTPSVPLLARSISAAGRLDSGVDPMTSSNSSLSRSPSVSPSYRNAAAGKMKGTSSGHFPPVAHTGVCVPQSPTTSLCTVSSPNPYKGHISCPESLGRIREDASSSSSMCIPSHISTPQSTMLNGFAKDRSPIGRVEQNASQMGFTFGTIMPEVLHRNRPQERHDDVTMPGVEDHRQQQRFLEHCVHQQQRKLQNMHINQFHSEQDNLGLRFPQSCPDDLASQGFPHLDMIDDLLDEEQSRGKVALGTKLQNPGEQILNGQFYLPGFHGPKIDLHNGSGFDGFMTEEDGTLQMACPSDWCSSGLSESMQVLPPYAHSSPSQYYDQYNGQLEDVSPHNWSMYSADMPQKSFMNNGHGPIASPMGNSIQGHHYSAGHCSNFTLGPNGYTFY